MERAALWHLIPRAVGPCRQAEHIKGELAVLGPTACKAHGWRIGLGLTAGVPGAGDCIGGPWKAEKAWEN